MLFPYKYVPHKMEKMQTFIDFIFYEVWCKASVSVAFSFDLITGNDELKELMEAFHYSDAKGADFFNGHVERIYGYFAGLTPAQIEQFKSWYQANNDIEKICVNDPVTQVVRYADIKGIYKELTGQLADFFKGLYSQQLLDLAVLRQKIGDIDDHYKTFMGVNKTSKCPFCGIADMQGIYHSTREAYDHCLPKGLYPFNSINFRNLVPACHHCNSSYKTTKDPTLTPKDPAGEIHRRKVFYPYANPDYSIEVVIDLSKSDVDHLTPDDVQLIFGPSVLNEEIETWKDVYNIEERYKAKCCSESDGKYWLAQILDEWREGDCSPEDFLNTLNRQATRNPFADSNFLKKAFLDGCQRIGLFNDIAKVD